MTQDDRISYMRRLRLETASMILLDRIYDSHDELRERVDAAEKALSATQPEALGLMRKWRAKGRARRTGGGW